jgi:hypothetical protein
MIYRLCLLLVTASTVTVDAFTVPRHPSSRVTIKALSYSTRSDRDDIERNRARFERLIDRHDDSFIREGFIAEAERNQLFLTTSGRRMREVEMQLLQSLEDSDDAIDQLVHLWTTERDEDAASDMLFMDVSCSRGLEIEEARLWQLIEEHPGWAEPHARLAAVLFHKGGPMHGSIAADMAVRAIDLKPWHFEALHLMVAISANFHDMEGSMHWSSLALPPLDAETKNRDRKEWVKRSLMQAKGRFQEAERMTTSIKQGTSKRTVTLTKTSDDSWQ